jgi:hypothetical protein
MIYKYDSNKHVTADLKWPTKKEKAAHGKFDGPGSDAWHNEMHKDACDPMKGAYTYGKKLKRVKV